MKCLYCDNPATIHLTDIIQHQKREMHLCERCARARKLLPGTCGVPINLKGLLQLLLHAWRSVETAVEPQCPHCGLSYTAFQTHGRIGCAADYELFRQRMEPLLERIHRSVRHCGKRPRFSRRHHQLQRLRRHLQRAIAAEKYEHAARLRDLIRRLERPTEGLNS